MRKRETSVLGQTIWPWVLIVYIGIIYVNSLTPARISSQQSGFLLERFRDCLEILGHDSTWLTEHIIRKSAHFIEYTGLGCLLCAYCRTWLPKGQRRLRTAGELALFVPFVDETIQLFVSGRSGQISDVWLDVSGVVCGLAIATVLVGWRQKRKTDRGNEG